MPTSIRSHAGASSARSPAFALGLACLALGLPALAGAATTSAVSPASTTPAASTGPNSLARRLLFLNPKEQIEVFANIDKVYATRTFARGKTVHPLPASDRPLKAVEYRDGKSTLGLEDFMRRNRIAGVLVVKDGKVALERYGLGMNANSRWTSFSVGKSFVSTLVGAAIRDGAIHNVNDPVTRYLPALQGSAYEGVTIRNMLQMSSGVKWNENYQEPGSDIGTLLDCTADRKPGCIAKHSATLPRAAAPGTVFNYDTAETHLLGAVVSAATHKTLSAYLSEKIWAPYGMEQDGYWMLESDDGLEMAGGCLSMTLRDYARFGLFILGGGVAGGHPVLPDGWLAMATRPAKDSPQVAFGKVAPDSPVGYGYQWWAIPDDGGGMPEHAGAYAAEGVFGQFIYINPAHRVVVAVWSAWPGAWEPAHEHDTMAFLAATVHALH